MTTIDAAALNAHRCAVSTCANWTNHVSGVCARCREKGLGLAGVVPKYPTAIDNLQLDRDTAPFDASLASRTTTGKQAVARTDERRRRDFEHAEQVALFAKIDGLDGDAFPELRQAYAVPNGGNRSKRTAGRLKAEGVRAGELDINLDLARGGFFGLRLEMKAPDGSLSVDQRTRMEEHRRNGYAPEFAYGCDDAWRILTRYVQLPQTVHLKFNHHEDVL
jgi:hypothetical protein